MSSVSKIFDLPKVSISMDEVDKFNVDYMKPFNELAKKNPNNRIKIDLQTKTKCNHKECLKIATYKYIVDQTNLCWYHAYLNKE